MASHGEEITEVLYDIVDWSWSGHGPAPSSVTIHSKNEGYPLAFIDRDTARQPALFFVKGDWPAVVHHPKITTETYRLSIYITDRLPSSGYPETSIRRKMDSIVTNILASKDTDTPTYNLTYPMGLNYIEDIRWIGTFMEDEVQELINALELGLVSAMSMWEIQAYGTQR